MSRYVVVDTETTGLDAQQGRITWLAAAVVVDGAVTRRWSVRFGRVPGPRTDAAAVPPTFGDVAQQFTDLLNGGVLVAHNASFDVGFLKAEYRRAGLEMPRVPVLCTLRLARSLQLGVASYSLVDCCAVFGIAHERNHRADEDVEATAALLNRLLPLAVERGWNTTQALLDATAPADPDRELSFEIIIDIEGLLVERAGWRPDEEPFDEALTRYGAQLRAEREAAYRRMTPAHRQAHLLKDALPPGERRASAWRPVLDALEAAGCPEAADTWIEYGHAIEGPEANAKRAVRAFRRALEIKLVAPDTTRADVAGVVSGIGRTCAQADLTDLLIETYLEFGERLRTLPPCGDCGDPTSGCQAGRPCRTACLASRVAAAPFTEDYRYDTANRVKRIERRARAVLPLLATEPDSTPYVRAASQLAQVLATCRRTDDAMQTWNAMVAATAGLRLPVLADETYHLARALARTRHYDEALTILTPTIETARVQQRPTDFWRLADLAGAYLKATGHLTDAINLWYEAIDSGTTIADTFERLSHTLEQQGAHEAAVEVCETAWSRFTPDTRRSQYAEKIHQRGIRCRAQITT